MNVVTYYAKRNNVEFTGGNRCRIGGQDRGWFDAGKTLEAQRKYAESLAVASVELAQSAASLPASCKKAIAHRKQMIVQNAGLLMRCLERIRQIEEQ